MMNVSEYANDVGKKVSEILKLCQTLDIKVSNEEDMLSDDDIIMLDNEIANMDEEEEVEELEEEIEDFADSYEEELEEITSNDKEEVHKKKNSIKKDIKKNDFRAKRKEMYKHKEKLVDVKVTDTQLSQEYYETENEITTQDSAEIHLD